MGLTIAAMEKIIAGLPHKFKMPNGDTLPIRVITAPTLRTSPNAVDLPEQVDYPLITIRNIADGGLIISPDSQLSYDEEATRGQSDAIAYSTGTTDYLVTQRDIKAGTTSITGTRSAAPFTFVEGTHYSLAGTFHIDPSVGAHLHADPLDTIRWIGLTPDNGTTFTVTYEHFTPTYVMGGVATATLQLNLYARDIKAGEILNDALTGLPLPAITTFWHNEDVMRELATFVQVYCKVFLNDKLVGQAAVKELGELSDYDYFEGEGVMHRSLDLVVQSSVTVNYPQDGSNGETPMNITSIQHIDYTTVIVTDYEEP